MKLLFDENISYRIVKLIIDEFPNSNQVKELKLENKSDIDIWDYSKKNGFTVVSYDGDFCDLSAIKGHPPKIIWLRVGNKSTKELAKIILRKANLIKEFCDPKASPEWAVLEIT